MLRRRSFTISPSATIGSLSQAAAFPLIGLRAQSRTLTLPDLARRDNRKLLGQLARGVGFIPSDGQPLHDPVREGLPTLARIDGYPAEMLRRL